MKTGTKIVIMTGMSLGILFLILVWVCGSGVLPQIADDITSDLYYRKLADDARKLVRITDVRTLTAIEPAKEDEVFSCWIRIEGTDIDYPVMQEDKSAKEFYLNHRPDGRASRSGSLYIPYYDSAEKDNVIIYGHHMRNGTMFGGLNGYKDKNWARRHSKIELTVNGNVREYEVVAVIVQSLDDRDYRWEEKIVFEGAAEKKDYLDKVRKMSMTDMDVSPDINTGTRFITLVTCDYSVPDGRLVVVAIG